MLYEETLLPSHGYDPLMNGRPFSNRLLLTLYWQLFNAISKLFEGVDVNKSHQLQRKIFAAARSHLIFLDLAAHLGDPAPRAPSHRASDMGKTKSSSKHSRAQARQQNGNGHVLPSKLARYLDPEASWDKDQLLDAVHWIRQVLGLVCGLLWGAVPLVGAVWIALFLAISTGIIYWYYAYLLKIDEEEFGGHGALLQEGMFASFTLFLLSWILIYGLVHF